MRRGVGCIEGKLLDCQGASNGIVEEEVLVEAGVHTVIVERVPSGPFSVSVEEQGDLLPATAAIAAFAAPAAKRPLSDCLQPRRRRLVPTNAGGLADA